MSIKPYCSICWDNHPLSAFRFLPCGHGICVEVLRHLRPASGPRVRARYECPMCREPFHSGISIYIESRDPASDASQADGNGEAPSQRSYSPAVLKQATYVKEKFDKIGPDSKPESVVRSAKELGKVVNGMEEGDCAVKALLSSIALLLERLTSVFVTLALQKNNVSSLQCALQTAREENRRLRSEVQEAEKNADGVIKTAQAASEQLGDAMKEIEQLKGELRDRKKKHAAQLTEKVDETAGLYKTLHAHKAKETKQAERIRDLKKQLATAQEVATHNRNRLVLETPASSRTNTRHMESLRRPVSFEGNADLWDDDTEPLLSRLDLDDADEPPPLPPLLPTPPDDVPERLHPLQSNFTSDWNLELPVSKTKRKRTLSGLDPEPSRKPFPIMLDNKGRPKGPVQLGSRQREKIG
ncbi:uncharacterized protein B0H18DRAFT_379366 [Fomitopsis serialis]|uniref:uncharacterized protein n=1 Tax=Fomitopsis serialis TaxID=139415 RepID=UPI0020089311|nr:uncharacterized protein B0H18DRAFT_379366 [Neoantrodia serialis]KAH9911288.1 hypothetical protein B0H18DRAFT_379366 [Neoantrodia serialis]